MFVFPAFDSNYKTRKRTFKCCRICRSKRMKCIISLTDYESVGCDNCQKHGFGCDLIQADYKQKSGVKGPIKSEKRDETRDTETPGSNPRRSRDSSRDSRDQRVPQRANSRNGDENKLEHNHITKGQAQPIIHSTTRRNDPDYAPELPQLYNQEGYYNPQLYPQMQTPHWQWQPEHINQSYPNVQSHQNIPSQQVNPNVAVNNYYVHPMTHPMNHQNYLIQYQNQYPTIINDNQIESQPHPNYEIPPYQQQPPPQSMQYTPNNLNPNESTQRSNRNTPELNPGQVRNHNPSNIPLQPPQPPQPPIILEQHIQRNTIQSQKQDVESKKLQQNHLVTHETKQFIDAPLPENQLKPIRNAQGNQEGHTNLQKPTPSQQFNSPPPLNYTTDSFSSPFHPTIHNMKMITATYLKETFGFSIGSTNSKLNYFFIPNNVDMRQAVKKYKTFHNEPLQDKRGTDTSSGNEHILNPHQYQLLLSIDAFTLSSPSLNVHISQENLVRLLEIYFFKINSIFPVIRETEFWDELAMQNIPSVLLYCLVLAIARDSLCKRVLTDVFNVGDSDKRYEEKLIEFMMNLEMKIRQIFLVLPELGDDDILNRLKCLLLLTFNFNFNSYANEQNGHDLITAINFSFNLFIHMKLTHERLEELGMLENSQHLQQLWWICFVFDRLNSVINSRAVFIKREDFDIPEPEDPYLLQFVSVATEMEKTMIAIYHPNPPKLKVDPSDFLRGECSAISEESLRRGKTFPENYIQEKLHLPPMSVEVYRHQTIFFICRLIKHLIVLAMLRYNERKQNPDSMGIMNPMTYICMLNILKLFEAISLDKHGHDLMLSIPMVTCCLTFYSTVPIKYKISLLSKELHDSEPEEHLLEKVNFLIKGYAKQVAKFGNLWWFMKTSFDNTYRLLEDMRESTYDGMNGLEDEDDEVNEEAKKGPQTQAYKDDFLNKMEANRDKLKIKSLISSDNPLRLLMSITSPSTIVVDQSIKNKRPRKSMLANEVSNNHPSTQIPDYEQSRDLGNNDVNETEDH